MKLRNILLTGLAALALTSCDDYLEVDAPSSYTPEFVFSQKTEMNRALNGVYAKILVNDLYGSSYQSTFVLNSDVDMKTYTGNTHAHNQYRRFDCDSEGGEINKFWNASYAAIEIANLFIKSTEESSIYDENDAEIMQMIGEAKCIRAMVYHDMITMFGDVPFTFEPTSNTDVTPVEQREVIQAKLIEDLQAASEKMASSNSTTVERASKEFAWALIARIAMAAGGYSLHPDKANDKSYGVMQRPDNYQDFYRIAQTYSKKVMDSGKHALTMPFLDVFAKQSNFEVVNGDDVIFEIPFAKESTGSTGYIHGPKADTYEGTSIGRNVWGKCSGSEGLSAFYPFLFNEKDKRREINGLWSYGYTEDLMRDTVYISATYTTYNNKWSKLWANAGQFTTISEGSTGINFPYMRYADVLLMYAEATNELDGPTDAAQAALRQVRARAFDAADHATCVDAYIATAAADKATFLKAILDERKFEFAGENMRWKDLVRNNMYSEEVTWSFLRYLEQASSAGMGTLGYDDLVSEHDGKVLVSFLPSSYYYHVIPNVSKYDANTWNVDKEDIYGHNFPNKTLDMLYINKPFVTTENGPITKPVNADAAVEGKKFETISDTYQWVNSDSEVTDQCRYSFYGFIRYNASNEIKVVRNGAEESLPAVISAENLPVVRYILPYPNAAIQRSAGQYKNYYGYTN